MNIIAKIGFGIIVLSILGIFVSFLMMIWNGAKDVYPIQVLLSSGVTFIFGWFILGVSDFV